MQKTFLALFAKVLALLDMLYSEPSKKEMYPSKFKISVCQHVLRRGERHNSECPQPLGAPSSSQGGLHPVEHQWSEL